MKKYFAEFKRDNGTIQELEISKISLEWLLEHANQIEGIETRYVEPTNPCKDCGLEEMPNAFMQYCDSCFKKQRFTQPK
jgi:hypothetical protein